MNAGNFFDTEDSEDEVKFVNHNPTDYQSFHTFNESLNKLYEVVEKEKTILERAKNLQLWDENLPPRWRGASLSKMENPASKEALSIIKTKGKGSFFVIGPPGAGKTYLAYAILRKYIGLGWVTPTRIKVISEDIILNYAGGGFEGKAKFDKLFDKNNTVYLIDNVGMKQQYDSRREIPMLEQLLEHIYSNSLMVIFTSAHSSSSFANKMTTSGGSKLKHLIADRVVEIKGTRTPTVNDWTEEEQEANEKLDKDKEILDEFDG